MPPILDVSLGLVFIFLVFSLVISALNELILSILNKRADFLEEGLAELLADPDKVKDGPLSQLLNHGLVDSLSRHPKHANGPGKPTYVPADVFVAALLDIVCPAQAGTPRTLAQIQEAIGKLDNDKNKKLKQSLTAIVDKSGQDLAAFKAGLETWYNQGTERISGWYKRYAQQWLFWLGLALALICNIDAIRIVRSLSTDPSLRNSVVQQAIDYAKTHVVTTNGAIAAAPPTTAAKDSATNAGTPPERLSNTNQVSANLDQFQHAIAAVNDTGLPIGWTADQWKKAMDGGFIMTFFGCLITALAGTLGAPFWFDTLNRFITIRGNGRAPEEDDPTNPVPRKPKSNSKAPKDDKANTAQATG